MKNWREHLKKMSRLYGSSSPDGNAVSAAIGHIDALELSAQANANLKRSVAALLFEQPKKFDALRKDGRAFRALVEWIGAEPIDAWIRADGKRADRMADDYTALLVTIWMTLKPEELGT